MVVEVVPVGTAIKLVKLIILEMVPLSIAIEWTS